MPLKASSSLINKLNLVVFEIGQNWRRHNIKLEIHTSTHYVHPFWKEMGEGHPSVNWYLVSRMMLWRSETWCLFVCTSPVCIWSCASPACSNLVQHQWCSNGAAQCSAPKGHLLGMHCIALQLIIRLTSMLAMKLLYNVHTAHCTLHAAHCTVNTAHCKHYTHRLRGDVPHTNNPVVQWAYKSTVRKYKFVRNSTIQTCAMSILFLLLLVLVSTYW